MEEEISFFERPAVRALIVFGLMVIAYVVLGYYFTWEREGQLRREKERKSAAVGYEVELTPEEKNNLTADSFRREFESEAWDMALLASGLILWTVLFSQFILPVRKIRDRFGILDRMMAYFTGFHGPAIFVENGNIRSRQDETQKHGPGVIWLDHASAAVLRTATRFTRTISPGVHFTSRDEYIAATVDLHILTHTIGPNDHENPFTVAKDDEIYQRIQDS
ncbi:MAG: hypothetical protein RBS68_11370, partial [Anaerolineales bacterium]|nr:hypothetical protein [Anaerolineales bacterium]